MAWSAEAGKSSVNPGEVVRGGVDEQVQVLGEPGSSVVADSVTPDHQVVNLLLSEYRQEIQEVLVQARPPSSSPKLPERVTR